MKITKLKTTKNYFFAEIKVGDIFVSDGDYYLKIAENKLNISDYEHCNAIAIDGWTYSYFEENEEVTPVKSELIIEGWKR